MATTIKLKNGSGAPLAGDLVQGEPAFDLTNKRLYTEDSGGSVIEVGTNPTSLTTGTFTSTGIDDNATSTKLTVADTSITTGSIDQLIVAHSTDGGGIRIDSTNSTNSGSLRFGDDLDNYIGALEYSHTDNAMSMYVNNATRMTINSSGNVGIGTASPNEKLNVSGNVRVTSGFVSFSGSISTPSEAAAVYRPADNTLAFSTANTERMRINNNGRVGIGTTSPARILHVENDGLADLLLRDTSSYSVGTGPAVIFQGKDSGGTTTQFGAIYGVSNGSNSGELTFETRNSGSSAERMRIDSSGNVGIGVTPLGSSSGAFTQLQIGGGSGQSTLFGQSNDHAIGMVSGAYYDASNNLKYSATSLRGLSRLYLYDGTFQFANAPSGTGGATATLTERMRIDASGNVGIGTSSPNELLNIHENSSDGSWLRVTNSTTGVGNTGLLVGINSAEEAAILHYEAKPIKFSTSATERMRIDSSGNLWLLGQLFLELVLLG